MRYSGPKNRLARRQGIDLGLKTPGSKSHARLLKKLNLVPGQHGAKTRRKFSERALQLLEKQKLRFTFGISESQLKNYFNKAKNIKGNTALYLSAMLEKRLDNCVFRLGFAPTRAAARQMVGHGHIKINDKKLNIASYMTKKNDIISFSNDKMTKVPYIEKSLANKDILIPAWLEKKGTVGRVVGEPNSDLIESQINLRSVIEYYSR